MASRGQSITVTYVAWDTSANAGKTADVGNHTLRVVKDGTSAAPTNSPAEVDATNAPGVYKLVLTATECTADCVIVCGKSSTANVSIMPITVTFEQLPTAAPTSAGGVRDAAFINGVATSSVTTINANVGTTQPVNFTGTGTTAYVKGDAVDIGGAAAASATVGTVTNLTNAPTAGDFTTAMKTSLNAATPSVTVSDKTGFSLSTAGVAAIWNALTSGMITAGSIGKKLADWVLGSDSKAMISTDAQTGVVLPRVTLVDTTAVNSDMRGTDNAALAATALSNATWTGALATNLGTLASHDPGGTLATGAEIAALNNISAAAVATAVWSDTTASDFATLGSAGHVLVTQLGGAFTTVSSSVFTTASLANAPTGGGSGADPLTNASTSYVAGEIGYEIHWLYQRGNADEVIDTTSSPGWNIVYYVQGSTTELLRQRLLDISGNPVKLATTIVAQTKK